MTNKIPKTQPSKPIFYKYRTINTQNIEALFSGKVYFSSPENFNDPFDSKAHINIINDDEQDRIDRLVENYYPQTEVGSNAETSISDYNLKSIDDLMKREGNYEEFVKNIERGFGCIWRVELLQRLIQEKIDQYGIFCLSNCLYNLLMWSHYSDGHRGFCVEYEHIGNGQNYKLQEVKYCGPPILESTDIDESTINSDTDLPDNIIQNVMWEKAENWNYEQEARIVTRITKSPTSEAGKEQRLKPIGEILRVKAIIFGLKCPRWFMDLIYFSLELIKQGVCLYNMEVKGQNFTRIKHQHYRESKRLNTYKAKNIRDESICIRYDTPL